MNKVEQYITQLVNDHFAQTGIATVEGETILTLIDDIQPAGWSNNDYVIAEQLCSGTLRARPITA